MKEYIVRAPQTDRLLVKVPNSVHDFPDYVAPIPGPTGPTGPAGPPGPAGSVTYVTARGDMVEAQSIGLSTETSANLVTFTEMLEASADVTDHWISPDLDGLYLVTAQVVWGGTPAPDPALRVVRLYLGSTAIHTLTASSAPATPDSLAAFVRVLSGEKLFLTVEHSDSGATATLEAATLAFTRVAP